jgi:4-hydroxybenzoate polyprenyltransferase
MDIFKQYVDYFKDNPKGYWFKRKLYGWGWTPVKWQGWAIIAIFVLLILLNALSLGNNPTNPEVVWFIVKIILSVILLIYICYKKGEKPKWQWGIEDKDKI